MACRDKSSDSPINTFELALDKQATSKEPIYKGQETWHNASPIRQNMVSCCYFLFFFEQNTMYGYRHGNQSADSQCADRSDRSREACSLWLLSDKRDKRTGFLMLLGPGVALGVTDPIILLDIWISINSAESFKRVCGRRRRMTRQQRLLSGGANAAGLPPGNRTEARPDGARLQKHSEQRGAALRRPRTCCVTGIPENTVTTAHELHLTVLTNPRTHTHAHTDLLPTAGSVGRSKPNL